MTRFPLCILIALGLGACAPLETDHNGGDTAPPADDDDTGGDDSDTEVVDPNDADGDGSPATEVVDCDDSNPDVYPGAPELCDGLDNDCDGTIDDGLVQSEFYPDVDCDGYGSNTAEAVYSCQEALEGYVLDATDCNDADPATHPGAEDVAGDGIDQDCDDETNPGEVGSTDSDGDGSLDDQDCAPADATIFPGATETADDGIDQDCDGEDLVSEPEEGTDDIDYVDEDGDLWNNDLDCADNDAAINPAAAESFDDGIDQDCDGDENSGWEAVVTVEYPFSGYYVLNASFYTSGTSPNALGWQETDTQTSGTAIAVEFLTEDYGDMSGSCGLSVNVSENNPASAWLCENWEVDSAVMIDAWFNGVWYDESDVVEWIADNSSGSCAAVIQTNSSAACTPVNDN